MNFKSFKNNKSCRVAAKVGGTAARTVGGVLRLALKAVLSLILILLTACLLFACIFAYYVKNSLATELNITLEDYAISLSSTIWAMDEQGNPVQLALLKTDENRIWVDYEDIPIDFEHAAVAIEDKRFYEHKGVDWYRTAGAFVNMFLGMKNDFGGSTIDQQLIKNVTTRDDVTVQRKLAEIFQALELEKSYTKEEIMTWYLNVVYFGEGAFGVHMAADTYFGKDVSELSLAECASIIGITNNPSKFSPFVSRQNNKERQELILYEMYDQGYITYDEYTEAVAEELPFVQGENEVYVQEIYPYYVEVVIDDVINDLQTKLGLSSTAAERLLFNGGYQIYACVDLGIQSLVDSVYEDTANLPKSYYPSGQELQSACVVIDPYTGDIVALSGGVGEKDINFGLNCATRTRRPAGSSFKPLAVYGPALDLGLVTQSTLIDDSPDVVLNGTTWYPRNAGGGNMGIITVWDALVNSVNTAAAQIMDKLSPEVAYEYVTDRMGFQLTETDKDYAAMSLGQLSEGVTVREMAQAYTCFPNDGVMTYGRTYSHITDADGNLILDNPTTTSQVFSVNAARCTTEMMEAAAWYGTGSEAYLGWGQMPVAGKTGTTSYDYDRWFCGFSPYYVTAVWTGYETPESMHFWGNPATQIWKRIMAPIHHGLEIIQFKDPTYRGYPTGIFGELEETPTPEPSATPTDEAVLPDPDQPALPPDTPPETLPEEQPESGLAPVEPPNPGQNDGSVE